MGDLGRSWTGGGEGVLIDSDEGGEGVLIDSDEGGEGDLDTWGEGDLMDFSLLLEVDDETDSSFSW